MLYYLIDDAYYMEVIGKVELEYLEKPRCKGSFHDYLIVEGQTAPLTVL